MKEIKRKKKTELKESAEPYFPKPQVKKSTQSSYDMKFLIHLIQIIFLSDIKDGSEGETCPKSSLS